VFSNLFSITLPNIGKYFPGIHFPWNSLSKNKLLSYKQTGPLYLSIEAHKTTQKSYLYILIIGKTKCQKKKLSKGLATTCVGQESITVWEELLNVVKEEKSSWPSFHYNIIQFYRRINSVGDSNEIRRWKQYRRIHRRKCSVGKPVVGKSHFRR